ncbi:MAG TPA: hypothetical protein VEU72_07475 [Nitrosopumilaceae archaeon]|nr:hypothetical protein [Nitrosopumilaceae archaeon]
MEKLHELITVKEVNTRNNLAIPDEDCNEVMRSDYGKKLTEKLHQTTTAKQKTSKKYTLLCNPDIKRWYDNTARGSPLTADVRLRRLSHFCEITGITPMEFAKLAQKDLRAVTDLIQDHITWMEEKKHSPGYIDSTLTGLKSWLRHFDIVIIRKIKIRYVDSTPTLEGERVPDQSEMTEIFNRASLRTATTIALISKSGLRLQVLGNHDGTDGLTLADIPDIQIQGSTAVCIAKPPMITVRRTLSKTRHQYYTFLTENGTRKLLTYLNERIAKGEKLGPESPVIAPNTSYNIHRGNNQGKKFLPTKRIAHEIRETLRPRFAWRPYVLRAFFDTQLLMAESRGKIAHDFRVFFMGHKGSMEAKYTTNKGMLPLELIEEMKQAFRRSEEFLDLEIRIEQKEKQHQQKEMENLKNGQDNQMVVSIEQVEELIGKGWKLVAILPQGKAVCTYSGCRP